MNLNKDFLHHCEDNKYEINQNQINIINSLKDYYNDNFNQGLLNKIFLSLDNGRLAIIEILNGKVLDIIKIDNEKISRPYVLNNHMFIVRDNGIIKLN